MMDGANSGLKAVNSNVTNQQTECSCPLGRIAIGPQQFPTTFISHLLLFLEYQKCLHALTI